jgi:hypothetical protein
MIPDGNINSSLNYTANQTRFKMLHGIKHVFVINYEAFGYLETGEKVQFIALHCQSAAKAEMTLYAQKNYDPKTFINGLKFSLKSTKLALLKPIKKIVRALIS